MSTTFQTSLMRVLLLGCTLVACVALTGCEKKAAVALAPPKVTVAKPLSQEVRNYEIFDGNVSALLSVNLEARVPGYLTQILFQDGGYNIFRQERRAEEGDADHDPEALLERVARAEPVDLGEADRGEEAG